jgi:colanic acid/amylovoran biosynthesis glycosyltransferase
MLREKMDAAEFVVTCTAYNRDYLARNIGSKTPVFLSYHGVDFETLPTPTFGPRSGLAVLAVGRLVEQKGFRHLVEACAILAGSGRSVQCRIIGEGPLRESLAHEIERRRLGALVALEGVRPLAAVFDAYRQSTVLCVPSVVAGDGDRDGIPNVIIEAMSQGIPVVASDVSGIPEIVRDGRSGWLVPPADPAALARAIAEVADRPEEVASRTAAAHQLIREQFDANRNALALLERFRAVAAARGPTSNDGGAWKMAGAR